MAQYLETSAAELVYLLLFPVNTKDSSSEKLVQGQSGQEQLCDKLQVKLTKISERFWSKHEEAPCWHQASQEVKLLTSKYRKLTL